MSREIAGDTGGVADPRLIDDRPLLGLDLVSFSYDDGAPATLRDVSFVLRKGGHTAVLGGSGSGKSTLAKILGGWLPRGAGTLDAELQYAGHRLRFGAAPGPVRSRRGQLDVGLWGRRVAYVPQRAADFLTGASGSVGEEIAFALEQRGTEPEELREIVTASARSMGIEALLERDPAHLSGGQRRRLAVAAAVAAAPEVLVLDEPESGLDKAGEAELRELLRSLRADGIALVTFGRSARGLAEDADAWILLDGGTATASGPAPIPLGAVELCRSAVLLGSEESSPDDGLQASDPGRGRQVLQAQRDRVALSVVAECSQVVFGYPGERPVLDRFDLRVHAGETVALLGPNGAGKSTLLRLLAGLLRPERGVVLIEGRDIAPCPAGEVARCVGSLFQEPRDQLFERTALREVAFGLASVKRRRRSRGEGVQGSERAQDLLALEGVGLAERAEAHPYDLPLGAQRLLALATAVVRTPRLLLLDEPTVGLDRNGMKYLDAVIRAAVARGAGVLFTTHDEEYAASCADRVLTVPGSRV